MNAIDSVFFAAALTGKIEHLRGKIARYAAYCEHDRELVATSRNHASRYARRLRNHQDKLNRMTEDLAAFEKSLGYIISGHDEEGGAA